MMAPNKTRNCTLILEPGLKGHMVDGVHPFRFAGSIASCRVEASVGDLEKVSLAFLFNYERALVA